MSGPDLYIIETQAKLYPRDGLDELKLVSVSSGLLGDKIETGLKSYAVIVARSVTTTLQSMVIKVYADPDQRSMPVAY